MNGSQQQQIGDNGDKHSVLFQITSEKKTLHFQIMFYSEVILARKGPLGKIWLAAHFDKKLTKKQIFSTDISSSVESVLNPANPLALRVSGHLMLGIVRIYSRKMKYLVTDCADAMWKIDLAFRPKNVDIDPTIAQIIDDARHFGNISIDNEFPELENTAFPQDLLSGYDYPRLDIGRISDVSFGNEFHFDAESPIRPRPSEPTGSSSRRSVTSSIENTRLITSQQHRTSLSTAASARPSYGSYAGVTQDEDIPAFTEFDAGEGDFDSFSAYPGHRDSGPGHLLEFGSTQDQPMDEPPPFDMDYIPEEEVKVSEEENKSKTSRESLRVQQQRIASALKQKVTDAGDQEEGDEEGEELGAGGGKENGAGEKAGTGARKKKKKRVMIDDRVELPSRLIKQRRTDLAPILRQRGTEALQQEDPDSYAATRAQRNHLLRSSPLGHRALLPAGVRGMCAELQEVFGMSINAAPLPFPLKDGAIATPQADIEFTRKARNSEASVIGRTSLLPESQVHFSGSKSANASFLEGGDTMEGGYGAYGGEMSYDGGYDDQYGSILDENRQSLMDFGGDIGDMGAEEVKRSDSAQKGAFSQTSRQLEARPSVARNAVSELVASTFTKNGSELGSRSTGDISGSSKSTTSSTRHTRTEQFMSILEEEFQSAENSVVSFENLSAGVSKRVAAACFLEVLQLKTWGRIQVTQDAPFDDILLRPSSIAVDTSSRLMVGSM